MTAPLIASILLPSLIARGVQAAVAITEIGVPRGVFRTTRGSGERGGGRGQGAGHSLDRGGDFRERLLGLCRESLLLLHELGGGLGAARLLLHFLPRLGR